MFQMLRTLSLEYVEATYQSVALNLMAAIVFVLALIFGQEDLQFCTIRGQAKMWGVGVSAAGALTMVLWAGPTLFESAFTASKSSSIIGESMLVVSILAGASWNLLVVRKTSKLLTTFTLYLSETDPLFRPNKAALFGRNRDPDPIFISIAFEKRTCCLLTWSRPHPTRLNGKILIIRYL